MELSPLVEASLKEWLGFFPPYDGDMGAEASS